MSITDEDLQRARELVARWRSGSQLWDANDVAQALADERERTLDGRLLYAKLRVTEPGMVIYDGTELRWERDAQAVDGAGGAG